jgi:hypothetical protein
MTNIKGFIFFHTRGGERLFSLLLRPTVQKVFLVKTVLWHCGLIVASLLFNTFLAED